MGVFPNGRFIMEHTIKIDDFGVYLLQATSICLYPEQLYVV